jgi:membrane-associated phospholipid phosphatase
VVPGSVPPVRASRVAAAGLVVTAVTLLLVRTPPAGWEAPVGRAVHDLPTFLTTPLEVVMQLGARAAIPVVAVVLVLLHRVRIAVAALAGAWLAWAAAVLLKDAVDRDRPTVELLGRSVRTVVEGPGYPSSHAAIAAALATVVVLGLRLRPAPAAAVITGAALTALARVHLGAHWPLDVLGGAAVGVTAGALAVAVAER